MNANETYATPITGPTRFALHSVEGFGKSTLAAYFPRPVFLAAENAIPRDLPFRPKQFPKPQKWEDVLAAVESLRVDDHDFETLVVDTVDWIEPLIHQFVCHRDSSRRSNINKAGNLLITIADYGFGVGPDVSAEEMKKFLNALDRLQYERGMHVVLLMHSHMKKVSNPFGTDYDSWKPKLQEKCARAVVEWAENVFFGYFEVAASKLKEESKAKGVSTGRRLLGTQHNALYDAKNRMSLPSPIELGQPDDMIPCILGDHIDPETFTSTLNPPTDRGGRAVRRAPPEPPKPEPEPAPQASAPPPPRAAATKAPVAATPLPSNTTAAASPPPTPSPEQLLALTEAITRAKAKGDAYHSDVQTWLKKAGSDASRIAKIIERVTRETTTVEPTTEATA